MMLFCIELMFFALTLNFIYFSVYTFNITGQIFSLFIVTTVAGETSIGLSLVIVAYRLGNKMDYDSLINYKFKFR